jgi:transcriptional regulator with GAF, ATPase, and Fis domain
MHEAGSLSATAYVERKTLKSMVEEYERKLLVMALDLAHGNQRKAASSLGLLPSTLSEKMKRFGLRSTRSESRTANGMSGFHAPPLGAQPFSA